MPIKPPTVAIFGDMRPLSGALKELGTPTLVIPPADMTRTDILEFITKNQPACVVNVSTFGSADKDQSDGLRIIEQSLSLAQVSAAQKIKYVQITDARVFSGTELDKHRVTYNPYDPVIATRQSLRMVASEHQCLSLMAAALPCRWYLFRVGVMFDKSVGTWSDLYREIGKVCAEDYVSVDFGKYNGVPVTLCSATDLAQAIRRIADDKNEVPNGIYQLGTSDHVNMQRMFMEYGVKRMLPVVHNELGPFTCQASLAMNTDFWYKITKTPAYRWQDLLSAIEVDLTAVKD